MTGTGFAAPFRAGFDEFRHDREAFDGPSYLYVNEDVRAAIGYDPEGAWRHWLEVGPVEDRAPVGVPRAAPRRRDIEGPRRPFGLNVFGPFDAVSGLGTAARNLAAAVGASGVAFELRPYDVEGLHPRVTEAEAARPLRYGVNLVLANADQIRRVVSLYPDGTFDGAYTIAVWAWELPAFRADFHPAFALVDEVWTNSRFELAAIAAAAPVPVHLMPLPVPLEPEPDAATRQAARALWGLPEHAFVVLCPFDAASTERRKNPLAAVRAFRRAFGDDPRTILLVKHHSSEAPLEHRIAEASAGAANIRNIGLRLEEADMAALRAAVDAVVSAHRAEGFGLNLAEALAGGRLLVATDATGSRDFLDAETGWPVAARLRTVGERTGPYLADAVWTEPDEEALCRALRQAVADRAGREARIAAARASMAAEFSPEAIGARMRARLEALGLAEGLPERVAATAGAGCDLHVPPLEGREELVWPARLPLFSVLPAGKPGPARARTLASLQAQLYPFWEACLADPDLPPPEDAPARAAWRGGDLRVRLVDPSGALAGERSPFAAAAAATAGRFVVVLPEGAVLTPDALLAVAHALDREAPAELLSLGTDGAGAAGHLPPFPEHVAASVPPRPIVATKPLLLAALDEDAAAAWPAVLARMAEAARAIAHLPTVVASHGRRAASTAGFAAAVPAPVPPDAALALRFASEAIAAVWAEPLAAEGELDLAVLPEGALGRMRETAECLLRGRTPEHVVLVGEGVAPPPAGWTARLLPWLARRENAGLVPHFSNEPLEPAAAADGLFATTRRTLARIAQLEHEPGGPAAAAAALGLRIAVAPDLVTRRRGGGTADAPSAADGLDDEHADDPARPAWPALDLEAHVARVAALGLFDAEYYVTASPDVAASGLDPLRHYCEHGWRENRAPSFYLDPVWYRACFMREEEAEIDPLLHWDRFRNSGVRPSRHFDPAHVRRAYRLPPGTDPLAWFLARRRTEDVSPLREFDAAWYRARRRDLAYRNADPFEHYMRFGAVEGVNPSPDFDTRFYMATQMRGLAANDPALRNPLLHYLQCRDRRPVITSQSAALRAEIDRLAMLGVASIDLQFIWYDGLPQRVDALRTYLADRTLFMPFRIVFANQALAELAGDTRLRAALELPYIDAYDDPDICGRLAECFADGRCLREDGRPVLAFVLRNGGQAVSAFALRIAGRLATSHGIAPKLVFLE